MREAWFDGGLVSLTVVSYGIVFGIMTTPQEVTMSNKPAVISTLTEEYIEEHTDAYLGTVVLHAAEVRVALHQNQRMRELLGDVRTHLRALEANGDKEAGQLVKRLDDFVEKNP